MQYVCVEPALRVDSSREATPRGRVCAAVTSLLLFVVWPGVQRQPKLLGLQLCCVVIAALQMAWLLLINQMPIHRFLLAHLLLLHGRMSCLRHCFFLQGEEQGHKP